MNSTYIVQCAIMRIVDEKRDACSIGFGEMLQGLREIFDDDNVEVEQVIQWLAKYQSLTADWKQYAMFDMHKYTRNLVDAGNGKYNVMILAWGEGMGSSIHDHSNAHCFVKMLHGTLKETQYHWPQENDPEQPMKMKSDCEYDVDGVAYINDEIGLHRMENPSHSENAVSMHVYIPAFDKCRVFDERTGHVLNCPVTFWSVDGQKMHPPSKITSS